jgi:hypothetical protein
VTLAKNRLCKKCGLSGLKPKSFTIYHAECRPYQGKIIDMPCESCGRMRRIYSLRIPKNKKCKDCSVPDMSAREEKRVKTRREWQTKNREKLRDSSRRNRIKNNLQKRDYKLKYKYGISRERFDLMVIDQDNKCMICKQERKLSIDHCHTTNVVRGVLCHKCNVGIGHFQDNEVFLRSAIDYLQKTKNGYPE